MHSLLFNQQDRLRQSDLIEHANAIGLGSDSFAACLAGQKTEKVLDDQLEGIRLGVIATPTFFIGEYEQNGKVKILRRISGAQPYPVFGATIRSVLKEL
jgi:predicted DsbA family dithiol-disulfide isomerase